MKKGNLSERNVTRLEMVGDAQAQVARFPSDKRLHFLGIALAESVRMCDDANTTRLAALIELRHDLIAFDMDVEKSTMLSEELKEAAAEELELSVRSVVAGPFPEDDCTPEEFNSEMKDRYGV